MAEAGAARGSGETSPASAVAQLARWAAGLRYEAIPPEVLNVARDCLIDTVGVALAGSRTRVAEAAREVANAIYASGRATALGAPRRLTAPGAVFVNAAAAHALDFDDNCYAGFVHGSAVLVPAAFAVGEEMNLSGKAFLTALVAGAEVEYAVGQAATASLYEKGWWTTGVLGPIGAAAAAACAMGLDAASVAAAIAIATAGTGGAKSCFGTDGKPLLCGRAAEAGLVAATLAAHGASGPVFAFEDRRGFAALFNGGTWDPRPIAALGSSWSLIDPGVDVKRIPVCLSAHAAVDTVMELMAESRLTPGDLQRIDCDVSGVVMANLVHSRPSTSQEAQFSLPFAIACALVHGDIRLEHLDDAILGSPQLQALMARVRMSSSARWAPGSALLRDHPEAAYVVVRTRDGRRFERLGRYARGMRQRPLTPAQLDEKFMNCASRAECSNAAALLACLRSVDTLPSIRGIFGERARAADRARS